MAYKVAIMNSALTFGNFDQFSNNLDFYSHRQTVFTYNKLNMSNNGECAEPYLKGFASWRV